MVSFDLRMRSGRIVGMVSFGQVVGMVVRTGRSRVVGMVVGMVVGKMDVRDMVVDSVDADLIVEEGGNDCTPEKTLWEKYEM